MATLLSAGSRSLVLVAFALGVATSLDFLRAAHAQPRQPPINLVALPAPIWKPLPPSSEAAPGWVIPPLSPGFPPSWTIPMHQPSLNAPDWQQP